MNNTLEDIIKKYDFNLPSFESVLTRKEPIDIPEGRNSLAKLFNELSFKIGAEIGVEQGKYSEILCKSNPNLKLYCVDAWEAYKGYRDHVNQEKLNGFLKRTKELLSPYNCEIMKAYSMDAVKVFEDEILDFVYLDANHDFQSLTNDLAEWSKKVKSGGIISGHDYVRTKGGVLNDTVDVINAYVRAKRISPLFIWKGDNACSWMFVK